MMSMVLLQGLSNFVRLSLAFCAHLSITAIQSFALPPKSYFSKSRLWMIITCWIACSVVLPVSAFDVEKGVVINPRLTFEIGTTENEIIKVWLNGYVAPKDGDVFGYFDLFHFDAQKPTVLSHHTFGVFCDAKTFGPLRLFHYKTVRARLSGEAFVKSEEETFEPVKVSRLGTAQDHYFHPSQAVCLRLQGILASGAKQ